MATHAQLAAKLLRDAGSFFRNVGEQNPPLKDQMNDNADVYDQDPTGELEVQDQPEQK